MMLTMDPPRVGQAPISKIERQSDMLLGTLASYLQALGVDASLVVEVGEQTVTYSLTAGRGTDDQKIDITTRPVLLVLPDRRDLGQPHRQHRG